MNHKILEKTSWALLFKNEWRTTFPTYTSILTFLLGILIELSIYWYTSKAFGGQAQNFFRKSETDYFHFVVIGEIIVLLPLALTTIFSQALQSANANGTLDIFFLLPRNLLRITLTIGFPALFRAAFHLFCLILMAIALFDFHLGFEATIQLFVLQIIFFPLFTAIGIIAAAFFLRFGRGAYLTSQLALLGRVFAGVYFPTTVFPEMLSHLGIFISPFNTLVELSRWPSQNNPQFSNALWSTALWTLFTVGICYPLLISAKKKMQDRGRLEVLS